jgi:hypothetical protein
MMNDFVKMISLTNEKPGCIDTTKRLFHFISANFGILLAGLSQSSIRQLTASVAQRVQTVLTQFEDPSIVQLCLHTNEMVSTLKLSYEHGMVG